MQVLTKDEKNANALSDTRWRFSPKIICADGVKFASMN